MQPCQQQLRRLLAEGGIDHLAAAGQTFFLHCQKVDGNDDPHDKVYGEVHHAADTGPDTTRQRCRHFLHLGQDRAGEGIDRIVVVLAQHIVGPAADLRVFLQPCIRPAVYFIIIVPGIFDQHGDAVDQLRDQHAHQPVQQRQHHGPCQQYGGCPQPRLTILDLPVLQAFDLTQTPEDDPLKPFCQRRQQVSHSQPVKDRSQHFGQLSQNLLQCAALIKGVIKHQDGAHGQKSRQAPPPIDTSFHAAASF